MKKVILKVELHNDKIQRKAMQSVSDLTGVKSFSVDWKDQKITVIGDMDPVKVVNKLKKFCYVQIDSLGPAKEEKKGEQEQLTCLVNQRGMSCPCPGPGPCPCSCPGPGPCPFPYPHPCYYYKTLEDQPNGCVIC